MAAETILTPSGGPSIAIRHVGNPTPTIDSDDASVAGRAAPTSTPSGPPPCQRPSSRPFVPLTGGYVSIDSTARTGSAWCVSSPDQIAGNAYYCPSGRRHRVRLGRAGSGAAGPLRRRGAHRIVCPRVRARDPGQDRTDGRRAIGRTPRCTPASSSRLRATASPGRSWPGPSAGRFAPTSDCRRVVDGPGGGTAAGFPRPGQRPGRRSDRPRSVAGSADRHSARLPGRGNVPARNDQGGNVTDAGPARADHYPHPRPISVRPPATLAAARSSIAAFAADAAGGRQLRIERDTTRPHPIWPRPGPYGQFADAATARPGHGTIADRLADRRGLFHRGLGCFGLRPCAYRSARLLGRRRRRGAGHAAGADRRLPSANWPPTPTVSPVGGQRAPINDVHRPVISTGLRPISGGPA